MPLAAIFTSNFGWFFLDATETYISRYVVPGVGLLQCIAVGWVFEYDTTANASSYHARSLRVLSLMFWVPSFFLCLYCNLLISGGEKFYGLLAILLWFWISLFFSYRAFMDEAGKNELNSWYHEIVLCGTDKIAMGVTSLSYKNHQRKPWMLIFEGYFGLSIKFLNPVLLMWNISSNLSDDISKDDETANAIVWLWASMWLTIAIMLVFVPFFACTYPEVFEHNPNLEFLADNLYEVKLRMAKYLKE